MHNFQNVTTRSWRNQASRIFGKFASAEFPKPLQTFLNTLYVHVMHVDLTEFAEVSAYPSLNALFTRQFSQERPFDHSPETFIAPTDSRITAQGTLRNDTLLQIKGMEYSVHALLTDNAKEKEHIRDGDFINFYLSPRDYHRYHTPADLQIKQLIHVPGNLYPVNLPSAKHRKNLFVENERVILECEHPTGKIVYLVFVGALNVGQMVFEFEPRVATNSSSTDIKTYTYSDLRISKGDCLGYFRMGSTVVMICQKALLTLTTTAAQDIKFGEPIANVNYRSSDK